MEKKFNLLGAIIAAITVLAAWGVGNHDLIPFAAAAVLICMVGVIKPELPGNLKSVIAKETIAAAGIATGVMMGGFGPTEEYGLTYLAFGVSIPLFLSGLVDLPVSQPLLAALGGAAVTSALVTTCLVVVGGSFGMIGFPLAVAIIAGTGAFAPWHGLLKGLTAKWAIAFVGGLLTGVMLSGGFVLGSLGVPGLSNLLGSVTIPYGLSGIPDLLTYQKLPKIQETTPK